VRSEVDRYFLPGFGGKFFSSFEAALSKRRRRARKRWRGRALSPGEENPANLRFEWAYGNDGDAVYLSVGEAFQARVGLDRRATRLRVGPESNGRRPVQGYLSRFLQ
jgi:hypothetical protein